MLHLSHVVKLPNGMVTDQGSESFRSRNGPFLFKPAKPLMKVYS